MLELLFSDASLGEINFNTFEYSSGLFKTNSGKRIRIKIPFIGFQELFYNDCLTISQLAIELEKRIAKEYEEYEEIILVCHSMGGLIARQMLINIRDLKIKKLILFGTPVHGTFAANIVNFIFNNIQISDLRKNSEFLKELNEKWKISENTRSVRVINVATILDPYTSVKDLFNYWNPSHDDLYVLNNKLHFSMIFPKGHSDKLYEIIRRSILD